LKTLILGLGNPILSDDSVGFRVARELMGRFDEREVVVMESDLAGLSLLDLILGYDRVIIVDSIQTVGGKVGQAYRLGPDDFATTRHAVSPHDVNFGAALELGKRLGLDMPKEIIIFAVEVQEVTVFSESCTPEVERVIPKVVEMVASELVGGDEPKPEE
jgi:hydrogenase maturation protease